MAKKQESHDLLVFITRKEVTCSECKADLGRSAWITLIENKGPLCLTCADLDHLVFLPSGDPALTRRSRKHSTLSAVVLRWSRTRNQYERQGLLVEEPALEQAEQECLADNEARERRRMREAVRREELDQKYIEQFAQRVRELFPGCPPGIEMAIAEHACQKYSGRVGRSATAKELDPNAVRAAVVAHIRHTETDYDQLLNQGIERWDARSQVEGQVDEALRCWSN